jgi:hypothetical protein
MEFSARYERARRRSVSFRSATKKRRHWQRAGTHYQQDVDSDKVFMDVATYNQRVMGPAQRRKYRR